MAALVVNVPFLMSLSRHKEWMFVMTAVLLAVSLALTSGKGRECEPGSTCTTLQGSGQKIRVLLWISLAAFLLALFLSYLLVPLLDVVGAS